MLMVGMFLLLAAFTAENETVAAILLMAALFSLWVGLYLTFDW
jgi:disulfide bond formation protein DsbB